MKTRTLAALLVLPALLGVVVWDYADFLMVVLLLWLDRYDGGIFAFLLISLVLFAPFASYYAVRNVSRWKIIKIVLSVLLPLWIFVSFYMGAYLGELWAVHRAKSYLDGVVRSADDYLRKNGEYPESVDILALPPMPRLVKKSAEWNNKQEYKSYTKPYQRLDAHSIIVGFDYMKGWDNDDCASYTWTTKNPRWVCTCHGCLTDNPNRR